MLPLTSLISFLYYICAVLSYTVNSKTDYTVEWDESKILTTVHDRFLSLAVSVGSFNKSADRFPIDYQSLRLNNILAALQPSFVRVGGTRGNFIRFVLQSGERSTLMKYPEDKHDAVNVEIEHKTRKKQLFSNMKMFDVTIDIFHKVYNWVHYANSNLIWDINAFFRQLSD